MGENNADAEGDMRGDEQAPAGRLADDELYRALASGRRRRLLALLLDQEQRTVGELATLLAGWEAADEGGMLTPDAREHLLVELIHVHLPRLSDAGLLAHDGETGVVTGEVDATAAELVRRALRDERA